PSSPSRNRVSPRLSWTSVIEARSAAAASSSNSRNRGALRSTSSTTDRSSSPASQDANEHSIHLARVCLSHHIDRTLLCLRPIMTDHSPLLQGDSTSPTPSAHKVRACPCSNPNPVSPWSAVLAASTANSPSCTPTHTASSTSPHLSSYSSPPCCRRRPPTSGSTR